MSQRFPFLKVYGAAGSIALITLYGLLSALLGDGAWDVMSWVALAIPLAVIIRKYNGSQNKGSRQRVVIPLKKE